MALVTLKTLQLRRVSGCWHWISCVEASQLELAASFSIASWQMATAKSCLSRCQRRVLECCASRNTHCNSQPGAVLMPLQLLIASLAGCIVNHARLIVVLFSLAEQQSDRHSASGIAIINMPLSHMWMNASTAMTKLPCGPVASTCTHHCRSFHLLWQLALLCHPKTDFFVWLPTVSETASCSCQQVVSMNWQWSLSSYALMHGSAWWWSQRSWHRRSLRNGHKYDFYQNHLFLRRAVCFVCIVLQTTKATLSIFLPLLKYYVVAENTAKLVYPTRMHTHITHNTRYDTGVDLGLRTYGLPGIIPVVEWKRLVINFCFLV